MMGDSSLLSFGEREKEILHTRGTDTPVCTCGVCTNPSMLILLWQLKASMQVPDRNFQLTMEKVTTPGSCHTARPGLFCGTEHLATSSLPCLLRAWHWRLTEGEVCTMMMCSRSKLDNFNSYQTLGQNKSSGPKGLHFL